MGVREGYPGCIQPDHLGRADYNGACVNEAARFMDAGGGDLHAGACGVGRGGVGRQTRASINQAAGFDLQVRPLRLAAFCVCL